MNDVSAKIAELKLVPVVKIEKAEDALALGQALLTGGLPLAEITFPTARPEEAIRIFDRDLPDMLIGAGTVLTVDNVKRAVDAGAQFMVAPGFNPKVVDYCLANGLLVMPGVNSPTDVEMGLDRGLDVLKFFPAEASGELKVLKALSGPYGGVKFSPHRRHHDQESPRIPCLRPGSGLRWHMDGRDRPHLRRPLRRNHQTHSRGGGAGVKCQVSSIRWQVARWQVLCNSSFLNNNPTPDT